MAKKEAEVRVRLQRAAMKLFGERGYDGTTAAEIAASAGVTERTFFRHYPDKREVLFDGEVYLRATWTAAVADAPGGSEPMDALLRAFRSTLPVHEANRSYIKRRQEIIDASPALHERELAKSDALADALADALRARGVDEARAGLGARAGLVAFAQAVVAWLDDPAAGLGGHLDRTFGELKHLSSGINV